MPWYHNHQGEKSGLEMITLETEGILAGNVKDTSPKYFRLSDMESWYRFLNTVVKQYEKFLSVI